MNTMSRLVSFFLLILCLTGTSQALEDAHWNDAIANPDTCQVDRVIIHEQGVVLLVDNFWIGAQEMQATPDGILVLENGEWIPLSEAIRCQDYYTWQCRVCKAWNAQGASKCGRCGKSR